MYWKRSELFFYKKISDDKVIQVINHDLKHSSVDKEIKTCSISFIDHENVVASTQKEFETNFYCVMTELMQQV